jgi:two-component system response regulator AtoC
MAALSSYNWPGNIRELQNVIERAVIVSTGFALKVSTDDLKPRSHRPGSQEKSGEAPRTDARNARKAVDESERQQILEFSKKLIGLLPDPGVRPPDWA